MIDKRVVLATIVCLTLLGGSPQKLDPQQMGMANHARKDNTLIAATRNQTESRRQTNEDCGRDNDNRKSELCAQWMAADAASAANMLASWQLLLSALGVFGLALTLWFNFKALSIAESQSQETATALNVAEKNAAAAAKLAEVSEDSARKQIQAYVVLQNAYVSFRNGEGFIQFDIFNCGASPALRINYRLVAETSPIADKEAGFKIDLTIDPGVGDRQRLLPPLAAGAGIKTDPDKLDLKMPDYKTRAFAILLHIEFIYDTVFDEQKAEKYKLFAALYTPAPSLRESANVEPFAMKVMDATLGMEGMALM